jgi:hypothetical protein
MSRIFFPSKKGRNFAKKIAKFRPTPIRAWAKYMRRRSNRPRAHVLFVRYEQRGALRGTPGSSYPQPEPNATELPSSAPGRPKFIELQASTPSPTPTHTEEHIATTPDCRPCAPAPSPTPIRAEHLSGLQIVRRRALASRRVPKGTSHYICRCGRGTLHLNRWECLQLWRLQPRCCRCV